MAEEQNKQVRQHFEADKRDLVNASRERAQNRLARRAAVIDRRYNKAWKHRIAQGAS